MNRALLAATVTGIIAGSVTLFPIGAQTTTTTDTTKKADSGMVYDKLTGRKVKLRKPGNKLRECPNRSIVEGKVAEKKKQDDALLAQGKKPGLLSKLSLGNNPREGQYRAEMERLLGIEIANVKRAVLDAQVKHKELIVLYPQLKNYQEIILEDVPGAWRDGVFVSSKKLIIMHYDDNGDIGCVVLESFTRSIYNPGQWTKKMIRLYYPHIQFVELETLRHNYRLYRSLEFTSPEIQLKGLRLVFGNLRAALYSMDMLIAAYYDLREKKNDWQINF